MYQKVCRVEMEHDEPVEVNSKGETNTMNATFGSIFDFNFKVSFVEETFPSDSFGKNSISE